MLNKKAEAAIERSARRIWQLVHVGKHEKRALWARVPGGVGWEDLVAELGISHERARDVVFGRRK